jgi:tetratricopeptide (TPR) repeat protein
VTQASDIDRLIEEGLTLYGGGDVDGALLAWEQALAMDPGNEQVSSYVDYVRMNYELLTSSEPMIEDGSDAPFGIEEEPEYQIEILPGEMPAPSAPMHMDHIDEGWFLDEAPTREANFMDRATSLPNTTLELEAEEPSSDGVSFEDATREYHGPASEFSSAEFTGGFSESTTDVRKRDLGFVQPVAVTDDDDKPMIEVKLRTPKVPLELGAAGRSERMGKPPVEEDDLIASLPSPRQVEGTAPTRELPGQNEGTAPTRELPFGMRTTRNMPNPSRPPANRDISAVSQAEVMLPHAKTEDLDKLRAVQLADPIVSAPTRELGLRPPPTKPDPAPAAATVEGTRHDIVLPFDPIDARTAAILEECDEGAPAEEAREDKTRRRITALYDKALAWNEAGELDKAVAAVDLAMNEDPNSALAQKLLHRHRDQTMTVFQNFLGDMSRQPQLAKPLHELASAPISPRAAFLLSRIDGMLSIDEILDVSGMPRLEAYRHLCQLFLRGILR